MAVLLIQAEVHEGVELAVLAARIDSGRQVDWCHATSCSTLATASGILAITRR